MPRASARTAYSAFISHAKADEKKAKEIAAAIEERGFKCWIAPRDVRAGHSYGDEIVRGIEKSRAFILVLSKASNGSAFVAREVERAVSKGKAVYAIRVENVQPSPSLELFISGTQWIDAWSGRLAHHTDSLANLLRKKKDAGQITATTSEPGAKPPMLRRLRSPWLLGGGAATIAAIALALLVLKPLGLDGKGSDSSASRVDDPDYQACSKLSGDTAITFCDRAIASGRFGASELASLYVMRGYERGQKNDTEAAMADYNEAIRLNPANPQAHNNRGNILRSRGELDLAFKDFDEAIRADPSYANAFNNQGLTYKAKAEYDQAIKSFNEAIRINQDYLDAIFNRGDAYRAKGDVERAKEDYQKALALNPNTDMRQRIAAALSALGVSTADKSADPDYQGCEKLSGAAAIAACDRAIASKSFGGKDLAELHRMRGWERREKNDAEGAMSDYNRALQIDPANLTAYYNRGVAYYADKQLDLAIKDFDEAIHLKPDYTNAFWRRGKTYQAKGEVDRAKQDYNKALSLNPEGAIKEEIEAALKAIDQQSGAGAESGDAANAAAESSRAAAPPPSGSSASQQ